MLRLDGSLAQAHLLLVRARGLWLSDHARYCGSEMLVLELRIHRKVRMRLKRERLLVLWAPLQESARVHRADELVFAARQVCAGSLTHQRLHFVGRVHVRHCDANAVHL